MRLAAYSASSARRTSSLESPKLVDSHRPTLIVTASPSPNSDQFQPRTASTRRSTTATAAPPLAVGDQQRELVAAESSREVGVAQVRADQMAELPQHGVAGRGANSGR